MTGTDRMTENDKQMLGKAMDCMAPSRSKSWLFIFTLFTYCEGANSKTMTIFFYQKSFVFRFLANCFGEANLYNTVG